MRCWHSQCSLKACKPAALLPASRGKKKKRTLELGRAYSLTAIFFLGPVLWAWTVPSVFCLPISNANLFQNHPHFSYLSVPYPSQPSASESSRQPPRCLLFTYSGRKSQKAILKLPAGSEAKRKVFVRCRTWDKKLRCLFNISKQT